MKSFLSVVNDSFYSHMCSLWLTIQFQNTPYPLNNLCIQVTAHVASAGPGLMWKVYSGYKKTTRQPASVFVLERAALERFDRQDKEQLWDLMKRGVSQLTRLR